MTPGGAVALLVGLAIYVFICFLMHRIANKFRPYSFAVMLIPIYNMVLLCDCGRVTRWIMLLIFVPYLNALVPCVVFGKVAQRLGHNFWVFALLSLLPVVPLLILAFNASRPVADGVEQAVWSRVGPGDPEA